MQRKSLSLVDIILDAFVENARQVITIRQNDITFPEKIFNTAQSPNDNRVNELIFPVEVDIKPLGAVIDYPHLGRIFLVHNGVGEDDPFEILKKRVQLTLN
jgi:hypothetical protein